MDFQEKVKKLIGEALQARPDLFLIEATFGANNAIKVVIDGDQGVSIEDCVELSRAVEHNLDREEQDFSLEVSSYGIAAPLLLPRQYQKNVGRHLSLRTETQTLEGEILRTDAQTLTLRTQSKQPKPVGKGKILVTQEVEIPFSEIKEAKLVIKF